MASHNATYTEGSVFRHVSGLSGTAAIGLFAIFVVDLVDVFFISLLGEPELAASVGFAGVALFFGAAVCIGLAIAVSTLVAQAIGADDECSARRLATHGLLYALVWTIPVAVVSWVYAPELLAFLGAEGVTLNLAVDYFRIVGASLPVLGCAMAGTALLRASGDGRWSMWATLIGGIVNAVIDPILIFGAGLDLTGAAIASVISRFTVAGVAIAMVHKRHELLQRIETAYLSKDVRQISTIALPSLITNLSGPVGAAYATMQMSRFGTDAVAAAAVIGRITPVAFAGLYGLSGAVGPIASQNMGAGNFMRVRGTLLASAQFAALYVLPVSTGLYFLQDTLIQAFSLTGEAAELLSFYATVIAISYLLFALQLSANPLFTALRHPGFATVSNLARDILLVIPLIALLSVEFGARGVLAGQAIGQASAGVATFWVALWLSRRVEAGKSIDIPWCRIRLTPHRMVAPGVQHRGH